MTPRGVVPDSIQTGTRPPEAGEAGTTSHSQERTIPPRDEIGGRRLACVFGRYDPHAFLVLEPDSNLGLPDHSPRARKTAMIAGFANRRTEAFYRGRRIAAFTGFARTASRKLDQLDAATRLGDLARPGNRLEALRGRRAGRWSIRINNQWRICFEWPDGSSGPTKVEIVDYH